VTKTIKIFDITILKKEEVVVEKVVVPEVPIEEKKVEEQKPEEVQTPPPFSASEIDSMTYEQRFTPTFVIKPIPGAPDLGRRYYAGCKIAEITQLGLMTIHTNETVLSFDDYSKLTL